MASAAAAGGLPRARSANFCDPGGGDLQPAPAQSLVGTESPPQSAVILTVPYQLGLKTALFQDAYPASVGCSVQGRRPGVAMLGINPGILEKTVKRLGFARVAEEVAEVAFAPEEGRLNLLYMTSAKSCVQLSGPSYLVIKPFVGRMYFLCTKWLLVQSMRSIEERMRQLKLSFHTGSGRVFSHEEFTPFTLNLNNKDLEEILAELPGAYLAKPAKGSMGQLQQLVHIRRDRVREDLLDFLMSSQFLDMRRSQVILQRYIERPLLVDKRKFDMRVYMLVVNPKRDCGGGGGGGGVGGGGGSGDHTGSPDQSGYFVFMHPGFLRLCTAPYDPQHTDLAVHLTNQSIQAKHAPTFRQLKEVTTWYPDELNQYLNRRRRLPEKNWARDVLYPKVGAILGYVSALFRRHLDDRDCPTNTFRILGVDFLVDAQLRIYLLEFNSHPSWSRQTSVLNKLKPNLWREAVCLTSEVAVLYRSRRPVREDSLVTRQNFRLIYSSEETGMARQTVARLYE